jgi:3-oxoacyl-[acyl-carrier protein] reductase
MNDSPTNGNSGLLHGQTAIVTGGGGSIGRAIAERLCAGGARVAIADINLESATAAAVALGEHAMPVYVDVTSQDSTRRMVESVVTAWSRLDILVNSAGVAGLAAPVESYPVEEWRRVLAINLDGAFLCCRAALPHMLERGYGRIVNIASISGKEGNPQMAAYSASKGALIAFTKALAKETATRGVACNSVTPAVIETPILEQLTEEAVRYMVSKIPMGRTGQASEVAALVGWLCSAECSFSTGAVFDISGGRATY